MSSLQAVSKVIDAIEHAVDNDPSTNPIDDLKEVALLTMPKLDAQTLVKYTGSIIEHLGDNTDQQKEEERLEQERLQREQAYKINSIQEPSIKKEFDPFAQQNQSKETYSVAEYMQMRDALRGAGIAENQSELNENEVESILRANKIV